MAHHFSRHRGAFETCETCRPPEVSQPGGAESVTVARLYKPRTDLALD